MRKEGKERKERYNEDTSGMYPELAKKLNETPPTPPTSATQNQASSRQGFFSGSRNASPHSRASSILLPSDITFNPAGK